MGSRRHHLLAGTPREAVHHVVDIYRRVLHRGHSTLIAVPRQSRALFPGGGAQWAHRGWDIFPAA